MPATMIAKCTPSLGNVSIWWSRCTESILWPNNAGKAIFYLRDQVGGEVAECRNALVDGVLAYSARANPISHILWIDDDVLVFPGCLLELLHQDRDIVSGVYFTKLPGGLASPLIYPSREGGTGRFTPNRVQEVWGHGMGLTLVRTEVYTRMRDELLGGEMTADGRLPSKDRYGRPRWYHTTGVAQEIWEDETGCVHTGFTEDTYFLANAALLGFKPRVVTTKHAFGFHFDKEKNQGYPEEQWGQWNKGEPIVWQTPDGPVVWD